MQIKYSPVFRKHYKKIPKDIQEKLRERLILFIKDRNHPYLHDHGLSGNFSHCRSFNVTSDWRVIYEFSLDEKSIVLQAIGTHSQLYG